MLVSGPQQIYPKGNNPSTQCAENWVGLTAGLNFFFFGATAPHWARATQRRTTLGRTPLDEWSARRRDLYLTAHNTHNRQTPMPLVGFEPAFPASEPTQTYALDRAATGTGRAICRIKNIFCRCRNSNPRPINPSPTHYAQYNIRDNFLVTENTKNINTWISPPANQTGSLPDAIQKRCSLK